MTLKEKCEPALVPALVFLSYLMLARGLVRRHSSLRDPRAQQLHSPGTGRKQASGSRLLEQRVHVPDTVRPVTCGRKVTT